MIEYAVIHVWGTGPVGQSQVASWHNTPDEAIAEAKHKNEEPDRNGGYMAVSTEKYGFFTSLISEVLYPRNGVPDATHS